MKTCTRCKESKPNNNEYFAKNKACKDGLNSICKQCIKEYRREYYQANKDKEKECMKKYYQNNSDKIKEYKKRYYQNNSDKKKEYNKRYYQNNKDKAKEYKKKYYRANKDKVKEYHREYSQNNKEKMRFYIKRWKVKNREKVYQNARIRQLNKSKGAYSLNEWEQTKMYFDNRCAYCGVSSDVLSQDHFIPLSKGGSYTKDNIIPACISCNSSKNNTDFKEWFTKQEFYSFDRLQKIENYLKEITHNGKINQSGTCRCGL